MISLDKCRESCNAVDDLSTKICIPSKPKDVNVMITRRNEAKVLTKNISCDCKCKVFNMIIRGNEAKILIKHISCDCKCRFNSKTCNSNQLLVRQRL